MLAAAETLRASLRARRSPDEQREYAAHRAALREALGEAVFTAAWEAGRALTGEQAVEAALAHSGQPSSLAVQSALPSAPPPPSAKSAGSGAGPPAPRDTYPTVLTDGEWRRVAPLIPPSGAGGRPREVDTRAVVDAILHVLRTGCGWRRVPPGSPPWSTVHDYYRRWRDDGTWSRIQDALELPEG